MDIRNFLHVRTGIFLIYGFPAHAGEQRGYPAKAKSSKDFPRSVKVDGKSIIRHRDQCELRN